MALAAATLRTSMTKANPRLPIKLLAMTTTTIAIRTSKHLDRSELITRANMLFYSCNDDPEGPCDWNDQ